jgi:hypothetical protein
MTGGRWPVVLLASAAVALLVAWYAGSQTPAPAPLPPAGAVRLGPDAGEPVDGYLARLPAQLPAAGPPVLALVQLAAERTAAETIATAAGAQPVSVVLRVPLPRVQTALRFEPLEPDVAAATALDNARQRAGQAAATDAARRTGRPRAVADAEARALADPDCRCVLALLVRADRAVLDALLTRPGVRAVHAADPGVTARELALAPLLPEQTVRVDPPPDDGPVPP